MNFRRDGTRLPSRLSPRKLPIRYESPQTCHAISTVLRTGGLPLARGSTPTDFLFLPGHRAILRVVLVQAEAHLTLFVSLAWALFSLTTGLPEAFAHKSARETAWAWRASMLGKKTGGAGRELSAGLHAGDAFGPVLLELAVAYLEVLHLVGVVKQEVIA